jgi:hypothetical protein
MNIFVLDDDIRQCARAHCDKHVVKMILEYTQILCTVCNLRGTKTPYRSTHQNHPCVQWANFSKQNWLWLKKLTRALNTEYRYRYHRNKNHAAAIVAQKLSAPKDLPACGLTEFPQVMPSTFRVKHNSVLAYRSYYLGMKHSFATWTRRRPPSWWVTLR